MHSSLFFVSYFFKLIACKTLFFYLFTYILFIFSLFLSLLGVNKHRLCSVPFFFFSRQQASREPDAVHTDMTICQWHRGLRKQWRATYVAKWESPWNTPTLCSLAAHLIYKCIHTRVCCHGSRVSVIGAQYFFFFPCRISSLKSLPALCLLELPLRLQLHTNVHVYLVKNYYFLQRTFGSFIWNKKGAQRRTPHLMLSLTNFGVCRERFECLPLLVPSKRMIAFACCCRFL